MEAPDRAEQGDPLAGSQVPGDTRSFMANKALVLAATLLAAGPALAQESPPVYTRADTLRGDWTTPGRAWWDVTFYDLHLAIDPADSDTYDGPRRRIELSSALAARLGLSEGDLMELATPTSGSALRGWVHIANTAGDALSLGPVGRAVRGAGAPRG